VRLLAFPSGRLLGESPLRGCSNVFFSPDSKTLIGWGQTAPGGGPAEARLWDTATGRLRRTLERLPDPAVSLSPDGRMLLSQFFDRNAAGPIPGEAAWWDVATGRECGRLRGVTGKVAWSPDGQSLFAPTAEGVRQLKAADGVEVGRFAGAADPIAVTPDGQALLAAVPEGVRVWDLATGKERGTVRHQAAVWGVGVHPDGPRLVSLSWNGPPKYWDLVSGQELVAPAETQRLANVFLDGRTQWARELSYPDGSWWPGGAAIASELAKTSAAGPGTLLVNDRLRLVAEPQSLKLWPSGPPIPAGAAETARAVDLVHKGRLDAAVTAFRKAVQLAPADAGPRLLLADALDRQGKHKEAVAALDEACRLDPSCAWMFAELARPLLAEGRYDRALELLGKAVRYRPRDAAIQFQVGEALARAGAPDKAVGCYAKAAELYPDHGQAWARRAEALAALGRPEEAKRARWRAAEISPDLGSPARAQWAQVLADRARKDGFGPYGGVEREIGRQLLDESYLDEAIDHLRRATLTAAPIDNDPFLQPLAAALLRRGQYAEALTVLRLVHRNIPADATDWRDWSAGRMRDAERGPEREALRREVLKDEVSFRRRPNDARAGRALAEAYTRLSDSPKAAREWLAPDGKLPDDPELWCNLAGLLLLEQETELYRRLCERAAEYAKGKENGGFAYIHMYQITRLWSMDEKPPVETARVLDLVGRAQIPEYAAGRLHALGLACYRAGKYEDALRHLNECVTEHPEWSAQVLNYQALALTYHRLGKDDEARRWRARATAWIDRTAEEVARAAPYSWPLQQYDLQAMWLLERELARALPTAAP
jgi:tetratricopeptide (TPR) repeat protein